MTRNGDGSLQHLHEESSNLAELRSVKYVLSGQTVNAARPNVPRRVYERDKLSHYSTIAFDDNRRYLHDAIMPQWKEASSLEVDDPNRAR